MPLIEVDDSTCFYFFAFSQTNPAKKTCETNPVVHNDCCTSFVGTHRIHVVIVYSSTTFSSLTKNWANASKYTIHGSYGVHNGCCTSFVGLLFGFFSLVCWFKKLSFFWESRHQLKSMKINKHNLQSDFKTLKRKTQPYKHKNISL